MSAVTEELQADMQASSARAGLSAAIIDGLTSSTCTGPDVWKTVGESGVRVCVLAGERQDPVQTTREQGKTLKETGPAKNQTENKAFLVREAMHAWSLSHPALFAEGIDAWIARREMPVGYEEI
ncbi:hypothetical protein ASPZODRAFT_133895 [Penicilliopsis zonata CBS 506.65]|uniref:AB hydrolase-1 domain-containing protein n=1 Tax=Penicilliopsis zonata CBS 506.65 TaxID=1073090 RepID=A0A1L9SDT7_9EURO|nr:hypothetical protein ASPZODRAFT_133895 [Penicilliopsis zonata CBS 506.65]OJJ45254.1 hypothetical protein ASPZODRAFT_133895 [Penicilliopsis zonata CBS 506.65]